jgi:hypothetical protein
MSVIEWVVVVLAGIVSIFVGIQQFSAASRSRRKERIARIKAQDQFLRDWSGELDRPGHPSTPGVMERLQKIEGELKHNGGSTMKDAVKRIEQKLERIDSRIEKGDKRFLEGAARFEAIESEIEKIKRRQ